MDVEAKKFFDEHVIFIQVPVPKPKPKPVAAECEGHPAGPFDPMGETVYCDGSCQGGEF